MTIAAADPLRVLVLCTGNSARSQIAEALLQHKGAGRVSAASAGSHPGREVHPMAVAALADIGIDWRDKVPRGFDTVAGEPWDLVITVCDRAREACPFFPGAPMTAHWGMADPAEATGDTLAQRRVFRDTVLQLSRRIDLLLALPLATLPRLAAEREIRAIGREAAGRGPSAVG